MLSERRLAICKERKQPSNPDSSGCAFADAWPNHEHGQPLPFESDRRQADGLKCLSELPERLREGDDTSHRVARRHAGLLKDRVGKGGDAGLVAIHRVARVKHKHDGQAAPADRH